MNKKGFASILLIILITLLLLFAFIYITKPKQNIVLPIKDNIGSPSPNVNAEDMRLPGFATPMAPSPMITSSPQPTTNPIKRDSKTGLNIYTGTMYHYQLSFPTNFKYQNNDIQGYMERASFTNDNTKDSLTEIGVFVVKGILPDPNKIYIDATKTSGKYTLLSKNGLYIKLPNGQGQGDGSNLPRLEVFIDFDGILYTFMFLGVSDLNNDTVRQVLSSFTLTTQ